jgi:hypothetical protein
MMLKKTVFFIAVSAAFTMTMALYGLASIMPLAREVYAQGAPEQSCHPPGQAITGNAENPNCRAEHLPIPNCVGRAQGEVQESGCRNIGTCKNPPSPNRPLDQTPACPNPPDD